MTSDPIVSFYSGGTDHRGRTLGEILSWPDDRLEAVHDYIQWVFPTIGPSGVNPYAPLVTPETAGRFQTGALQDGLRRSLDRMLAFYGLRRTSDEEHAAIALDPGRFPLRARNWLTPGNHNHLRLTRIMQSLAALGLEAEARALQRCLLEHVAQGAGRGRVTRETLDYWRNALTTEC